MCIRPAQIVYFSDFDSTCSIHLGSIYAHLLSSVIRGGEWLVKIIIADSRKTDSPKIVPLALKQSGIGRIRLPRIDLFGILLAVQ